MKHLERAISKQKAGQGRQGEGRAGSDGPWAQPFAGGEDTGHETIVTAAHPVAVLRSLHYRESRYKESTAQALVVAAEAEGWAHGGGAPRVRPGPSRAGPYPPGPQVVQQVVADLRLLLIELGEQVQEQREAAVVLLHLAQVPGVRDGGGSPCVCPLHTPCFLEGGPIAPGQKQVCATGSRVAEQCPLQLGTYLNIR